MEDLLVQLDFKSKARAEELNFDGDMKPEHTIEGRAAVEIRRLQNIMNLLCTLLDRIEIEQDYALASQRFEIAEQCGFKVFFRERISGRMQ